MPLCWPPPVTSTSSSGASSGSVFRRAKATVSAMKCVAVHRRSRTVQPDSTANCRASVSNRSGRTPRVCQRGRGACRQGSSSQRSTSGPSGGPGRPCGRRDRSVFPAGKAMGQEVEQGGAGADLEGADCGRRPVGGIGRQVSQPRGAAEVQQHAAAIALPQQEPLGQGAERATASALGKVAGREGIEDVQAGQLGHPGRIAPAEVAARSPWASAQKPGLCTAAARTRRRSARRGQQAAHQGGLGFRQMGTALASSAVGQAGASMAGRSKAAVSLGTSAVAMAASSGGHGAPGRRRSRRPLLPRRRAGDQHADEPAAVFAPRGRIEGEDGRHSNANWSWALGLGSWGSEHRA